MADTEHKDGGALKWNKFRKHPKAPHFYGQVKLNEEALAEVAKDGMVFLSGWLYEYSNGSKMIALRCSRRPQAESTPVEPQAHDADTGDDDIPF